MSCGAHVSDGYEQFQPPCSQWVPTTYVAHVPPEKRLH